MKKRSMLGQVKISKKQREPNLFESIIPIICLVLFLVLSLIVFSDDVTSGPAQISLILAGFIAALIAIALGKKWKHLEEKIEESIRHVVQAIFILLLVGALIGTWIMAGIIPTLIVYGLKILSPDIFLVTVLLVCSLASLATGSSWSTAGTLGIMLISVGNAMGIQPGITAGAIISGAYFGDKLSPFSETTNLASSMTQVPLIDHIKHMLYTTAPAYLISLILFAVINYLQPAEVYDQAKIEGVIRVIESNFHTGIYLLLPLLLLFFLAMKKKPVILSLLTVVLFSAALGLIFQSELIRKLANEPSKHYLNSGFKIAIESAALGFKSQTGVAEVDKLLSKGGMADMLTTVWIILTAMFFSGIIEGAGMNNRIMISILKYATNRKRLFGITIGTTIFTNITVSEQYMALVINGRIYKKIFQQHKLHPKNLSRALEDSGTLTSPLIPWNTCGVFMATALGVPTLTYLPFCFFNIASPIVSFLYGYFNITIEKVPKNLKAPS